MNKAELIDAIAEETQFTKVDSAKAVNAFVDVITKTMKKGDEIQLVGFGTFRVTKRDARDGRNPQTGEALKVKASKNVKFKAGKELKQAVNGSKK